MSLDAFKNLFSEKADANIERVNKNIAKYNAKLAEFNEIWPIAMAEAENVGMGETFVKMFPEGGGFGGGDPFQGISTEYINLLEYGDPLKPLVKKLYKLENSAERLKKTKGYLKQAIKYKEDGADAYILKIRQEIGGLIAGLSNPDSAWDNFIKFGDKFLEDPEGEDSPIEGYSRSFKQAVDGPSGVLSSTELFLAVKEQGNPASKISEEPEDDEITTDALNPDEISEETEPSSDSINPDEISEEGSSVDGPINDGETETVETEPENEVESIDPEIDEALVESVETIPETDTVIPAPISEQEDNFTEVTAPSPINAPTTDASFDTNVDGNISMDEYTTNAGDVFNNISENVTNEISSINSQNDAAQAKLEKTEKDYEASIGSSDTGEVQTESPTINNSVMSSDITNTTETSGDVLNETTNSEINEGEETNINSVNSSEQSSTPSLDDESFSFDDVSALRERFGIAESSDDSLSDDSINDSVSPDEILNDNSSIEGDLTEVNSINNSIEAEMGSVSNEVSGGIEVAKSKLGIDKNIAPINTPKNEEIKEDMPNDSVTMSEVLNDESTAVSSVTTSSESTDNSMSSESMSNSSMSSSMPTDMSGVESRLRKIENLLSGPLEVKIID